MAQAREDLEKDWEEDLELCLEKMLLSKLLWIREAAILTKALTAKKKEFLEGENIHQHPM